MARTKKPMCTRCGAKPHIAKRGFTLCEDCYGKCRDCGGPVPRRSGRKEGYKPRCRACDLARPRKCRLCGREVEGTQVYECDDCARIYQRQYKEQVKSKQLKQQKEARDRLKQEDPEVLLQKERRKGLQKKYGLSLDDFDKLVISQGGVCAICKRSAAEAGGRGTVLHVDHCHATGKVRGLLCSPCNTALGFFQDNPERLRVAADYLEKHSD